MRRSNHTPSLRPQRPPTARRKQQRCVEAEAVVVEALRLQHWRILTRNFRHIGFELDLAAIKGGTLIVVEVKARARKPGSERDLTQLLPRKKREALLRGTAALVSRLDIACRTVRIDLAVVYPDALGRLTIDYHVHAVSTD